MSAELMHRITAARPGFYSQAQRDDWEQTTIKREIAGLRQEIALAEAKAQRLQDSIKSRKVSLARLESQAVLTAPVRPCVAVSAVICR